MLSSRLCGRGVLRAVVCNSQIVKAQLTTSAVRSSAKTPIQEWGWQYLLRQKALKRPISPHLNVYKPQMTWMTSGAHRITGCIMAVGGCVVVGTLLVAPFDFVDFINYVKSWNLPRIIPAALKFVIAFFITFHTLNGIRFLGMDMAKGINNTAAIYRSAYGVIGAAVLLAVYFAVIMTPTLPVGKPIEQRK